MIIKIAVDGGHDDCYRQPWLSPEAELQTATWTEYERKDPHNTKYAMVEIAGWQVEFHEFREHGLDNKWLLVWREADKLGPACREAKIHIRDSKVGGTLVLKLKKKCATAQLLYGDLSAKLWDMYSLFEVKNPGTKCQLLNRMFSDGTGNMREVKAIFSDARLKLYYAPNSQVPESFDLTNTAWAVVITANLADGKSPRLVAYTALSHGELEMAMEQFLHEHSISTFFDPDAQKYAMYRSVTPATSLKETFKNALSISARRKAKAQA